MLLSQQAGMCLGRVDGKWAWAGSWWQRCEKAAVVVLHLSGRIWLIIPKTSVTPETVALAPSLGGVRFPSSSMQERAVGWRKLFFRHKLSRK